MLFYLKSVLWNSFLWLYLSFLLRVIRLFIRSRNLLPLIPGFLFTRDVEKRLIHDEEIRGKSMTPKTIYCISFCIPHFTVNICSRKLLFKGHVIKTAHILNEK